MALLRDTVITVLHDLSIAYRYADYAVFMKDGEIYAAGPVEEAFSEDVVEAVYGVRPLILRGHKAVVF